MFDLPPYRPRNEKPCRDHTGRVFPSLSVMAAAWGLSPVALRQRLFRKWPLEKALTLPPGCRRECCDHTGRKFPTVAAMARAWGLSPDGLRGRLQRGWPLERALTAPRIPHHVPVADPESGVLCPSVAELARGCGITPMVMQARIRRGATGAALVFPGDLRMASARDHTGREFPSLAAMSRAWGQPYKRFERRLSSGWELERALTAPGSRRGRPKNKEKK